MGRGEEMSSGLEVHAVITSVRHVVIYAGCSTALQEQTVRMLLILAEEVLGREALVDFSLG